MYTGASFGTSACCALVTTAADRIWGSFCPGIWANYPPPPLPMPSLSTRLHSKLSFLVCWELSVCRCLKDKKHETWEFPFCVSGLIFETEIVSGEDSRFFQASIEQYVKQVCPIWKSWYFPRTEKFCCLSTWAACAWEVVEWHFSHRSCSMSGWTSQLQWLAWSLRGCLHRIWPSIATSFWQPLQGSLRVLVKIASWKLHWPQSCLTHGDKNRGESCTWSCDVYLTGGCINLLALFRPPPNRQCFRMSSPNTKTRTFQVGSPTEKAHFNGCFCISIHTKVRSPSERFLEIPGEFGNSVLQLYYPKFRQPPKKFAWMTGEWRNGDFIGGGGRGLGWEQVQFHICFTGPGIYYGNIDITESHEGHENVTTDSKLMLYPGEDADKGVNPKTIVLTEFHVLVLFPERWSFQVWLKIISEFGVFDMQT